MRVVIPSVHFADLLAVTLPAWRETLPAARLIVVTAPQDEETQAVARQHDVRLCVTKAWGLHRGHLNKAAALDRAFRFHIGGPHDGERCLALDADVYPIGAFPHETLRTRTLYSCARYECLSPTALEAHLAGRTRRADLPLIRPRMRGLAAPQLVAGASLAVAAQAALRCLGYFQLFRYRPGLRFGSFRSAGKYDLEFRRQFTHRDALLDFYVVHLGEQSRANWKGRVTPRWGGAS
jgi:hypothetical protein